MAGILLPGSARPGGGDIEGVTAGDGLSGGGTSGSVTVTLDLNELTAAAVADGDFIAIIDANDSNASRKEAVADLATLFAGDGLTASSSVLAVNVDDSTIETNSDAIRIKADGVAGAQIADDAIDSEHYTDGSIDTAHIADNNVTAAKIFDLARGSVLYGNASAATAELTKGSANTVLTSDGTDISWAAAPATAADDIGTGDGAVNIVTSSGNITIDAQANDADVIIKVDDNGSAVTAVTFDGSAEGNAIFVNDIELKSDSAVLKFGADLDTTLTHTDGTGLTLNSTNKLTFGDAATFIHQSTDGTLTIDGEAIIDLNASTRVDVSGDLKVGGEVQTASIGYTDGDDSMTIADGGGVTFAQNIQTADIELGHASDTTIARSASGTVTIEGSVISTAGVQNMWIPATAMTPRDNAGCASIATVAAGTNGRPDFHVLDFDKDSDEHAQFMVAMPKSWDGGNINYYVYWIGIAATTGVAWGLQALSLNDNEEFDQAYGTAVIVQDDSQGDATELLVSAKSGDVACGGADGDLVCFQFYRDVSDGNDDMSGDARLVGILVEYTTTAATDA